MDASTEDLPLSAGLAAATASATASAATPLPIRLANHHNQNGHASSTTASAAASSRMQYRSRPVSVAVDPVSLVISECINITSAIQKYARSQHLSVSAILGGGAPSPAMAHSFRLGTPSADAPSPGRPTSGRRSAPTRGKHGSMGGGHDFDFGPANRWGLRGKKGKSMADNPLISGFGRLRQELAGVADIGRFDSLTLLYPFLQIIQAKGTAAPITILTLRAVRKFLAYGFISPASPRFALAMQALSQAITHCQFDISDHAQEEVVLLMILNLMEDMLSGPGGDILSDESVCDMMGRGLTICSRPRYSEVLRQTAEATMVRMCQIIFEDLKHLEEEAGEEDDALDRQTDADMDSVKMVPGVAKAVETTETEAETETANPSVESLAAPETPDTPASDGKSVLTEDETDLRPYSLPSVRELFRVLVEFLNPNQRKQQPDAMVVMALRIIHVALEVAGPSIARHPALVSVAQDRLCSYLFQLVRSDNMAILQEALTVTSTLLATCRGVLKLQQELYLAYLIGCLHPAVEIPREANIDPSLYAGIPQAPKLVKTVPTPAAGPGPGPSTGAGAAGGRGSPAPPRERQNLGLEGGVRKPEARQAMVESVGVLARMPTYMIELFVNYDCDVHRADLCEDMVGLLSRNALPDSATWSTTSVPPLCLDALLRFVQFMAQRLDLVPTPAGLADADRLRASRARKRIIINGAAKFNETPKGGLALLQERGIIDDVAKPDSVARFLKGTSRVSKTVLGEFLAKKGNESVLHAFMALFDFGGKRVDEALRVVLDTFRLPGESALIERVVSSFVDHYCAGAMPDGLADKDAVFILTYAIIMLNTDQHNPNVKNVKRMTVGDFARNLRGQNGGQDFAPAYLQDIFDSIRTNEIILPEEHDNKHAFDHAWRELLAKADGAGRLVVANTNVYDADMFATTWRPIVATLSYVFMSATDDTVFSRVIQGFHEVAQIAARYGNTAAMDHVVYCLAHMSTLAHALPTTTALNTEVQVDAGQAGHAGRVMVSELAVKLGRNFRAQLAALVLFRVVAEHAQVLRAAWTHVVPVWLNLFANALVPTYFDRVAPPGTLDLPALPLQNPGQVIDRGAKQSDTGFFSAFTSYISSYAADDPPEPSDEELESTLSAVDCLSSCRVGDVFDALATLGGDALEALVDALLAQLPDDSTHGIVIKVKSENVPPTSPASTALQPALQPAPYEPGPAYLLELCTLLALRDDASMRLVGKRVVDALQTALLDVSRFHPVFVGRVAYCLFALLRAGQDHDFVRVPMLLHAVSSFAKPTLQTTSATILSGLQLVIATPGPLRSAVMTSPDFWAILGALAPHEASAATVFAILESGVAGSPPAILADNYEAAIALCSAFATAAQAGATAEQLAQPRAKTTKRSRLQASDNAAVQRGIRALHIVCQMTERIPHLMRQSHLEAREAWSAYWLPIFRALTAQCANPCREIRQLAVASLQRTLLAPELTLGAHREWTAIFGEVLFPLILRLLLPEVYALDRDGMSETRVQAASLLCKVFLQYLVLLSAWDGMLDLWLRIIAIMDRLMNSGQGDSLEEAVPENLKNVLLFMASSGYLVSPRVDPSKKELWDETWKRIDRFLPELRAELMLEGEGEPEVEAQTAVETADEKSGEKEKAKPTADEPADEPVDSPVDESTVDTADTAPAETTAKSE